MPRFYLPDDAKSTKFVGVVEPFAEARYGTERR